jgi:DeoR/GlpR family transcriptional regulator of sugar metabolism
MEGSILELLEQHGSLAYEQIAAHLNVPPDQVRNDLNNMRERGWIHVLEVGHLPGERDSPAYWYLTGLGHEELARRRRDS